MNNLKQLGLHFQMYMIDFDDYFPPGDGQGKAGPVATAWIPIIESGHMPNRRLWSCPSGTARKLYTAAAAVGDPPGFYNYGFTQENGPPYSGLQIYRSYVIDRYLGHLYRNSGAGYWELYKQFKISAEPRPSLVPMAIDFENLMQASSSQSFLYGYDSLTAPANDGSPVRAVGKHHQGMANLVTADGSVHSEWGARFERYGWGPALSETIYVPPEDYNQLRSPHKTRASTIEGRERNGKVFRSPSDNGNGRANSFHCTLRWFRVM